VRLGGLLRAERNRRERQGADEAREGSPHDVIVRREQRGGSLVLPSQAQTMSLEVETLAGKAQALGCD